MTRTEPAIPLRGRPRRFRWFVLADVVAVLVLVGLTVSVVAGDPRPSAAPYEAVLVAVVFAGPPVVGGCCALSEGGLLPAVGLGVVPAAGWTVAVAVGEAVATLRSAPTTPADSPVWVFVLAFLVVGVGGSVGGFLSARGGVLAWRRVRR
ncbi:hypothetical protein [Halobaculum litoreum]|uniref:hypothetical protein n=1 Tax=Halobaculum litoreum TaxID=3031998 RepID=UPI0024C29D38|nr:hypothetical protein [Halobaculum sp. DT92]